MSTIQKHNNFLCPFQLFLQSLINMILINDIIEN